MVQQLCPSHCASTIAKAARGERLQGEALETDYLLFHSGIINSRTFPLNTN